MKKGLIIGLIVVLGVIVIIVGTFVSYYNRFVNVKEQVNEAWAQIDNQLKRRADLIPNLVNTTKGYAKHERQIFIQLAEARKAYTGARTVSEKMAASRMMDGALGRLLAIVENYPVLKANEVFQRLMDELAGTENRIAVERMRYNRSVKIYNIMIKRFPGRVFAGIFNFEKAPYFEVEEKEKTVPKVEF